jgi:hypothetical protein
LARIERSKMKRRTKESVCEEKKPVKIIINKKCRQPARVVGVLVKNKTNERGDPKYKE